jgi:ribosomal protein L11 methyltransferase
LYRAQIKLKPSLQESDIQKFSEALSEGALQTAARRESHNSQAHWIFECYGAEELQGPALTAQLHATAAGQGLGDLDISKNDWIIEKIPETDWLAQSYKSFPPFTIGPFYIHGAHMTEAAPTGYIDLQIEAATAFGSGEHGTTRGCIEALLYLKDEGVCPWNVLDMGTGSGILAIAAWKLWKTPVLAIDNDPEAIRVAARHCVANAIPAQGGIECETGEGFAAGVAQQKKPFDLIIANILAATLKEMASQLRAAADENGHAILSGILNEQAASVLEAYVAHGFAPVKIFEIGEWSTLVLHKTAA